MLPLLMAGLGLGSAVFKGIEGFNQLGKANSINPIRPTYNMPNQVREQTAMAYQNAMSNRMAGQSLAENNINRSTQNVINNANQGAGGSSDLMAAYTAAQGNENAAMNQIAGQSAQFQLQNKDKLAAQLGTEATYKDKEWDYNKKQLYEEEAAAKSALEGSGRQNLFGAVSDVSSMATNTLGGSGMLDSVFSKWKEKRANKQQPQMDFSQVWAGNMNTMGA